MTTKHLFTAYTIVMLSVVIVSAACKAFEMSLVIYLVWYGTTIMYRQKV
jgi:hypothetical protein